jgi:hypothetical protein
MKASRCGAAPASYKHWSLDTRAKVDGFTPSALPWGSLNLGQWTDR